MKTCHYCGAAGDVRPYGPKGAVVCFKCAMATPERKAETESNFASQLNACGDVAVLNEAGPIPFDKKEFKQ